MEGNNVENGLELNGGLARIAEGLAKQGGGTPIDPKVLEQEAAAKAAKETAALAEKNKSQQSSGTGTEQDKTTPPVDETPEVIQAKLDELAKKEDKDLTDEDKQYIEKYTNEPVDEINFAKQKLEERYGLKLEGEFTNDEEGLSDLVTKASKLTAEKLLVDHLSNVPLMADFYNHIFVEKRSFETFIDKNRQPAFKSIKIEEVKADDDEIKSKGIVENYRRIVAMDLQSKGVPKDDIEQLTALWEDKGILFNKAKEAYTSLDTRHKAYVDAKLEEETIRIEAEQKEEKQIFDSVVKMIDTNNFDGISIPASDVKLFKEALTKTDVDGNTLIGLKRQKLTLSQRVLIDYLVFKDLKNIGLSQATNTNRKFVFNKAAKANDVRGGGRLSGAGGSDQQGQITHPNFKGGQINFQVDRQTINN